MATKQSASHKDAQTIRAGEGFLMELIKGSASISVSIVLYKTLRITNTTHNNVVLTAVPRMLQLNASFQLVHACTTLSEDPNSTPVLATLYDLH